ncbi:MAG: hypothetical protein IIV43_05715 [Oscillospiraceae bacterium]|nr:hypothetical protein [Oscillospiraceae bacterium]
MIQHESTISFTPDLFSSAGIIKASALQYVFQEIGGEHAGANGMGITEMVSEGLMWAVTKVKYRLYGQLQPNTDYRLVTYPRPKRGMLYQRDYQIFDKDGKHLADGISQWCIMDFVSRKIVRTAKDFVGEFYTVPILPEGFERFRPTELTPAGTYVITESDLDGNNHTNNCRYADMVEVALPMGTGNDFSITFSKETRLGDTVELFTSPAADGKIIVSGMVAGQNVFSALV